MRQESVSRGWTSTVRPRVPEGGLPLPPANRVTRGDAEAVLQIAGTAGLVLLKRGTTTPRAIPDAPADVNRRATIRPFDPPHEADGQHFCAEDWHVIALAIIDGGDAPSPGRTPKPASTQ